jgi:solute carrier family 25 carnitine/acylcarnitine transporter 20/29
MFQTRTQFDPYGTPARIILKETLRKEGPHALFKGALTSCLGQAPTNFVIFGTYGSAKRTLDYIDAARSFGVPEPYWALFNVSLAGSYSGFAQSFVLAPVEHIKVQQQLIGSNSTPDRMLGTLDVARAIFKAGGLRHLMRGWLITALRDTPTLGIYFGSYELTKQTLIDRFAPLPLIHHSIRHTPDWIMLTAGAVAGVLSWAVALPTDVIKSGVQGSALTAPRSETTIRAVAARLYAAGGPGAFFRGFVPCILRAAPVNATIFLGYEWALKLMQRAPSGALEAD